MGSQVELETALRSERRIERRIALFGALLAQAAGPDGDLVIVGGSALCIYTKGEYVSGDVDVVGPRRQIATVLVRWGFQRDELGERPYWTRRDLGLVVELGRNRYSGFTEGLQTLQTPLGPVQLAAPEDLILRRLVLAKHGRAVGLGEAELLIDRFEDDLDYEYLARVVRHEKVEDAYLELLQRTGRVPTPPGPRRARNRVR
jgi:hypothetical protein